MVTQNSVKEFASTISQRIQSDRYCFLVCTGEMGEGKSCFTSQLTQETAKITKTIFTYNDNMTYSRKELRKWIDGEKDGKGQLPECSAVLCDELISMFFKRNWYDSDQIDGIELLNKCRDRHLLIAGCVPDFWSLDSAIYPLTVFWVHIHERGRAWVFEKDKNPFVKDQWHQRENQKIFAKKKTPYSCPNFVTEIVFDDWTVEEKDFYYSIRNEKRKDQSQRDKKEKFQKLKNQRDVLIKELYITYKLKVEGIAALTQLSAVGVYKILEGFNL